MHAVGSSRHSDILVQRAPCPTHGLVPATKAVPSIRFPFLVFAVLRLLAHRQPYRCPACGMAVGRA
jgi:hypothetical protein